MGDKENGIAIAEKIEANGKVGQMTENKPSVYILTHAASIVRELTSPILFSSYFSFSCTLPLDPNHWGLAREQNGLICETNKSKTFDHKYKYFNELAF